MQPLLTPVQPHERIIEIFGTPLSLGSQAEKRNTN